MFSAHFLEKKRFLRMEIFFAAAAEKKLSDALKASAAAAAAACSVWARVAKSCLVLNWLRHFLRRAKRASLVSPGAMKFNGFGWQRTSQKKHHLSDVPHN